MMVGCGVSDGGERGAGALQGVGRMQSRRALGGQDESLLPCLHFVFHLLPEKL